MADPTRRDFLHATAIVPLASALATAAGVEAPAAPGPWYRHAYRRAVIDMHIPDWDPAFLAKFDPAAYARALVRARAQSVVCYCQSHVGLFNYPTRVGRPHAAFQGRNVLGEMIDRCHEHKIAVQLYTSLVFDRTAADGHPDWRQRTADGAPHGAGGRHGLVCPNSPYRDYVAAFVQEICETFAFEGIRFDMTFWPAVCYCPHCKKRFADEVGGPLPEVVDWLEPRWVAFQRARERWLVEFAARATGVVRKHKPAATVEHQASTFPAPWTLGVTLPLAAQNDFLQGDFYGSKLQGSFVRKLLEDLTPHRPFGYETSSSVALQDHTALKAEALLEAKASAAIADHAAFIFIDAIDPAGTVNVRAHERMGRVFDRLMPYYEHLGGDRVADVGVFYSTVSKFSFVGNGRNVRQADASDSHTSAAMAAAGRMLAAHVPLTVLTRLAPERLARLKVLVLPHVNMLDTAACEAVRAWVKAGGTLYASGPTSLVDSTGRLHDDFQLADVFGASLAGKPDWSGRPHYVAPTADGSVLFPDFSAAYPAFTREPGLRVKARSGARVLATTTLPWPAPSPDRFASIHSDPPWKPTDQPEVVENRFGQGRCLYAATALEMVDVLRAAFVALIRHLHRDFAFEVDAPAAVEATLFHQPDRKRHVLTLVNFQEELPNIPIHDVRVRLRLPAPVRAVRLLPAGAELPVTRSDGVVSFTVPRLDTLALAAVETG